jgi:hypothetical protein
MTRMAIDTPNPAEPRGRRRRGSGDTLLPAVLQLLALRAAPGTWWTSLPPVPRSLAERHMPGLRPALPVLLLVRHGKAHWLQLAPWSELADVSDPEDETDEGETRIEARTRRALEQAGCAYEPIATYEDAERTLLRWGLIVARPIGLDHGGRRRRQPLRDRLLAA